MRFIIEPAPHQQRPTQPQRLRGLKCIPRVLGSGNRPLCNVFQDAFHYNGTSRTRKRTPLGPYRRPMPRVLGRSYGWWRFLISEVPLHRTSTTPAASNLTPPQRLRGLKGIPGVLCRGSRALPQGVGVCVDCNWGLYVGCESGFRAQGLWAVGGLATCAMSSRMRRAEARVSSSTILAQGSCNYLLVLESHPPHKTVNLIF